MAHCKLLYHTLRHLRVRQVAYQVWYRLHKPRLRKLFPLERQACVPRFHTFPAKPPCCAGQEFTFINLPGRFDHWQDRSKGMLWAYNLNYMDWLLQLGMSVEEGAKWIDCFIDQLPQNVIGQDPYPTALRSINWIKFICLHSADISAESRLRWEQSLYEQLDLLTRKLEYHLLANHLLEDLCALFIGALYFDQQKWLKQVRCWLSQELQEQYLSDGAHYEQSPMYHCILLDRLLDVYNFVLHNQNRVGDAAFLEQLRVSLSTQLGHLSSLIYRSGRLPLVNDSALGIAPTASSIFDYASALGILWEALPLSECGYRKLQNATFEALVDVGSITASYQPGHTHADSLSYELLLQGKALIVDTGISTYEKNSRRAYERSTKAHNTVGLGERNSSHTWGGFRVGKRAKTTITHDGDSHVCAFHDGYGAEQIHHRCFTLSEETFSIEDSLTLPAQDAVSLLHLAPEVSVERFDNTHILTSHALIEVEGATAIEVEDCQVSEAYNQLLPTQVIIIRFLQKVSYSITPRS